MAERSTQDRSRLENAAQKLYASAKDVRGVPFEDLFERVVHAVEKYSEGAGAKVEEFVAEIRIEELLLIIACEKGDERAWEDLVAAYDTAVHSAARKMSSGTEHSRDLADSIWAELYGLRTGPDGKRKSKLAYYTGRGSLAGWLRAVVAQIAVDQFRKNARFVQIDEDRNLENLASEASENSANTLLLHHDDDPEQAFVRDSSAADVTAALNEAVAALANEDRLILKLYYADGLKLKEIGDAFGFHEATASRRLSRMQGDIRKTVEASLRKHHGWNSDEVKNYLVSVAAELDISLEKLFALLLTAAALQDFLVRGVL